MFKNKYLKQLQDIQAQIKNCKANLAELKMPEPSCDMKTGHLYKFFEVLSVGMTPNVHSLLTTMYHEDAERFCKHLNSLGEYFLNISDYYAKEEAYQSELYKLKSKERSLKEKLGIE